MLCVAPTKTVEGVHYTVYITLPQMFVFPNCGHENASGYTNRTVEDFFSPCIFFLCLLSFGGSNPAFIMQIFNIVLSRMLFRRIGNLKIKLWAKSTAYEKRRRKK